MGRMKKLDGLRIVSLAPSVTSILLSLGVKRELVGVSRWCKDVAEVGSRPAVGDCWKVDLRDVMRLRPTILIGSVPFAAETVQKILAEPVAFLAMNPRSLADIFGDITTLGRLVNRARAAEKLIRKMRAGCAGVRVRDEWVPLATPELIVLAWAAPGARPKVATALRNAAWRDVPAVRSGRVVVIRDELLNTPGPPLVDGARELARAIGIVLGKKDLPQRHSDTEKGVKI